MVKIAGELGSIISTAINSGVNDLDGQRIRLVQVGL